MGAFDWIICHLSVLITVLQMKVLGCCRATVGLLWTLSGLEMPTWQEPQDQTCKQSGGDNITQSERLEAFPFNSKTSYLEISHDLTLNM